MKTLLLILAFAVAVSAQDMTIGKAEINLQDGAYIVHNHPDCTIREYKKGGSGAEWDAKTQTWKDSCWVGTSGFNFVGRVGVKMTDRALKGIEKLLKKEMDKKAKGQVFEYVLPNGDVGTKEKKSKKSDDDATVNFLIDLIKQNPMGTQITDIYEFPTGEDK